MTNTPTTLSAVHEPIAIDGDTDGRTLRRKRNRDAVIEALISLIREGDLEPTVGKIADRAEVSHRSIFRYFDDLNDLARTAVDTAFRNEWSSSVLADIGEGTLAHRVDRIVGAQLRTLARTHGLGRVARARAIAIPEIDRGLATINEFRVDQVRRQFGPELEAMDEHKRHAITTAIALEIGFDSYDMHYRALERTHEEIAEDWRITLHALLA